MLLHSGDAHEPVWICNVTMLSKTYRVYVLDVIGELNKRIRIRPIRSHRKLMDWMADLFDGLDIESADLVSSSNGWFFALETAVYLPRQTRKIPLMSVPEIPPSRSRKAVRVKIEQASWIELNHMKEETLTKIPLHRKVGEK